MNKDYRIPETIKIVKENILKYMHPLGLSNRDCGSWCDREVGETILYTGCLYTTMEIVYSRGGLLEFVTSRPDKKVVPSLARSFMRLRPLYRRVLMKKSGKIYDIPAKALYILDKMGLEVGCLSNEPYVGVLLYELGFHEEFIGYIRRVYKIFLESGVKRIITIDPHTYEFLKYIYPMYIEDYNLEILNIIDLIVEGLRDGRLKPSENIERSKYVYHDPCHYSKSRYRKIIDEPREILSILGVDTLESMKSRENSMCCGGPIETYFSMLAKKVAEYRHQDLISTGADKIVVSCPICFSSLLSVSESETEVVDIIDIVYGGIK